MEKKEVLFGKGERRLQKIIEINARICLDKVQYPVVVSLDWLRKIQYPTFIQRFFAELRGFPKVNIIYKLPGWFPWGNSWREIDDVPDVVIYECRPAFIRWVIEKVYKYMDKNYPCIYFAYEAGFAKVEIRASKRNYHVFLLPPTEKEQNITTQFSVFNFEHWGGDTAPRILKNESLWFHAKNFEPTTPCSVKLTRIWCLTDKNHKLILSHQLAWRSKDSRRYSIVSDRIEIKKPSYIEK